MMRWPRLRREVGVLTLNKCPGPSYWEFRSKIRGEQLCLRCSENGIGSVGVSDSQTVDGGADGN